MKIDKRKTQETSNNNVFSSNSKRVVVGGRGIGNCLNKPTTATIPTTTTTTTTATTTTSTTAATCTLLLNKRRRSLLRASFGVFRPTASLFDCKFVVRLLVVIVIGVGLVNEKQFCCSGFVLQTCASCRNLHSLVASKNELLTRAQLLSTSDKFPLQTKHSASKLQTTLPLPLPAPQATAASVDNFLQRQNQSDRQSALLLSSMQLLNQSALRVSQLNLQQQHQQTLQPFKHGKQTSKRLRRTNEPHQALKLARINESNAHVEHKNIVGKNVSCRCDMSNSSTTLSATNQQTIDTSKQSQSGDFRAAFPSLRVSIKCAGRLICGDEDTASGAAIATTNNKSATTLTATTNTLKDPQIVTAKQRPEKTIELAVFIDQALDQKFAGMSNGFIELKKQVLTIMNQVQHLFRYSSLSIVINLKLKLVESIKEYEKNYNVRAPNTANGDIDAYLANFCRWQSERAAAQAPQLTWDHAILLSGLDLFKASADKRENLYPVLGLAWIGGMCKENFSCTINEVTSFESAFVIAHELSHSLGILHDGQKNNCDPAKFIMSDKTGPGKVHWSRCSNDYLKDAIQRKQLECLESESDTGQPVNSLLDLSKLRLPGQAHPPMEQCKLAYGSKYTPFITRQAPFNDACRVLWCSDSKMAKSTHPALEGSSCDLNKTCREGQCVSDVSQLVALSDIDYYTTTNNNNKFI